MKFIMHGMKYMSMESGIPLMSNSQSVNDWLFFILLIFIKKYDIIYM
jgi:hypothetical protein